MIPILISYEKVKSVIDQWDPIELLATHTPSDEYDSESKEIFEAIGKNEDLTVCELSKLIFDVFIRGFGEDVFVKDLKVCQKIAEKIFAFA